MEKKITLGWSPVKILGTVYTILGAVFLAVGAVVWILVPTIPVGVIFLGLGGVFFILGIACLGATQFQQRRARALVESGRYVWAEVVDSQLDYRVTVNGRHPSRLVVRYTAPNGQNHLFRSSALKVNAGKDLLGKQVKVYWNPEKPKRYYVDAQILVGNYVMH